MGLMFAFLIGYAVGGKRGRNDLDEIVASAKLIAASDEFHDLVKLLRLHVGGALSDLGAVVSYSPGPAVTESIVDRVQGFMATRAGARPTSPGS